ncbi:hypothetical protein [Streptomyces mirabilis]|uniref:hypothetical protein n=1 Tax=Streptomyces mirabilis TaxID=68239 RepID=UPI0036BB9727
MRDSLWEGASSPIRGVYPFNMPGESVVLYDGPIGGVEEEDTAGRVELTCSPKLSLDWSLTGESDFSLELRDEVSLQVLRPYGVAAPRVSFRGQRDGWTNGAELGDPAVPLKRVVAHWFNLPKFQGQYHLTERTGEGKRLWSGGRWLREIGDWKIVIDVRPDHKDVWVDLHKVHAYVMTHVMELSRVDGSTFTAAEAEHVLRALHVGLSFGLGRWVAPLLPVGIDTHGEVAWEEWRSLLCDPARKISSGWWVPFDSEALAGLLDVLIPAFADPDRAEPLRLQINYAVTATNDTGFVEQRVMIGAAGLEHVMWERLVLSGRLTRNQYKARPAHSLLREVLQDAGIPTSIDPKQLPALTRLVSMRRQESGADMDGPDVVTWVRNRLVHPAGSQDVVYRVPGVVMETWLLTRHFLSLLILESLGYRGSYRNLAKRGGWVGEAERVPWA